MNNMKKKPLVSSIALMILILMGIMFYQLKEPQPLLPQPDLKVVMVTDSGSIDDKSFNQGTWEGIKRYETEVGGIDASYLTPSDNSTEAFLTSIDNAVLSGAEVVITPGFAENGVGLPQDNPNLTKNVLETVESVKHLIQTGEIEVPATLEETKTFLEECGMDSSFLTE